MHLPPLNALRAFEVASRHTHFTEAALELGVTPGAVGRHIKLLEGYLGVTLFERHQNTLQLTKAASDYAKLIQEAMRLMETATHEITQRGARRSLRVWCSRTFMRQWLVPRLVSYRAKHPHSEIVFSTSDSIKGIGGDGVDVAIRLGDGSWGEAEAHHLFDNYLVPVCSPSFLAKCGGRKLPHELLKLNLLQTWRRRDGWRFWLKAAGLGDHPIRYSLGFDGDSLAYQAAIEGVGVALARRCFFELDEAAGRVVQICDFTARAPGSFYLFHERRNLLARQVRDFCDWVMQEAATTQYHHHDFARTENRQGDLEPSYAG